MPIEIKELRIIVNVTENSDTESNSSQNFSPMKMQELKSDIIKECTRKVLEMIKESRER
ncbi:MAG: DUF5908 family protein [Candidatus Kapabacteria bacterium]|nr:DUF5908 family protein [Candidatus Kapabacteria bacterium]